MDFLIRVGICVCTHDFTVCIGKCILYTIDLRTVDYTYLLLQKSTFFKSLLQINIKFPVHKESENPWEC